MTFDDNTRSASFEFPESCPAPIRDFYEYWNLKRRSRPMPSRRDIDPAEIKPYLPGVMLIDVVSTDPLELTYRLVGTREVEARGANPTDRAVREAFYGRSMDQVLGKYHGVIRTRAPVYDDSLDAGPMSRFTEEGTLFLPLSDDGESVDKIIVFTAFKAF